MVSLIFLAFGALLLVLGVIAVIAATSGRTHGQPPPHLPLRRLLLLGTAGVLLLIVGVAGPFVEVPAGSVGVVTNFGQVQSGTLLPGLHIVVPIVQQVVNVDTRVQPHQFQEIDAASQEYQTVKLTGTMNYHVDGQYASDLYQRVGTDFASKVIDPAFNDFIKQVVPEYPVAEILAKRDEIRTRAKQQLADNLSQYHIIVDDIYIANIAFSDAFQQAIEQKQVAQQQVQTEQQILEQKRIQAQQQVVAAQGAADSAVVTAKGQAEANRQIAASLSDQILQYQYIQRLTDKIQVMLVPSGQGFLFDLNGILKPSPSATPAP
jgi:regulator of protease activity HflC (stomatin/prohibitin superfamily)